MLYLPADEQNAKYKPDFKTPWRICCSTPGTLRYQLRSYPSRFPDLRLLVVDEAPKVLEGLAHASHANRMLGALLDIHASMGREPQVILCTHPVGLYSEAQDKHMEDVRYFMDSPK